MDDLNMLGEVDLRSSMLNVGDALDQIKKLDDNAMSKLKKRYKIKKREVANRVDRNFRKLRCPLYEDRNYYIRSCPQFWRIACLYKLRSHLNTDDIEVFKSLKTLELEDIAEVKYGYSITFNFDVNEYFEDSSLTKSLVFSGDGISSVSGTKIRWKEGRDITCGPRENNLVKEGGEPKSFFTWFSDDSVMEKGHDQLAEEIEVELWPRAIQYFLKGKDHEEEELNMMVDRLMQRDDLQKLKEIQKAIDQKNHDNYVEKRIVYELYDKKLREEEMILKHDLSILRRYVYQSETAKSIPNFWLIAFLSHPALGLLLTEEDQKIFKFLNYMDVEYARTDDQISGYMITLKFYQNPYFENPSLSKAFSFSPCGVTYIRGPSIQWKKGMDITTGPRHEIFIKREDERKVTDYIYNTSFFTWFGDSDDLAERLSDQVAELIRDDLWPNAFEYFLTKKDAKDE